ncbi:MAG: transcription-repair coupling factor [Ruminococcaceae bacterium]|nr:transcription-repair coupling factor [Oscillospiraceae bacterium]
MKAFSKVIRKSKTYKNLEEAIGLRRIPVGVLGVAGIHKALIIHSLCENLKKRAFVITPDEASASRLCDDLNAFGTKSVLAPERDLSFISSQTSSKEYERMRIAAFSNWVQKTCDVVVIPASAVIQKTIPKEILEQRIVVLKQGEEISLEKLTTILETTGYRHSTEVEGTGQYSTRGGIVDFFPPSSKNPIRLELWGDEINQIVEFDPETQRRIGQVKEVELTPSLEIFTNDIDEFTKQLEIYAKRVRGKEAETLKQKILDDVGNLRGGIRDICLDKYINIVYENTKIPLSYLEKDDLLFVTESANVKEKVNANYKLYSREIKEALIDGEYSKVFGDLYINFTTLVETFKNASTVYLDNFARGSFDIPIKELVTFSFGQTPAWNGTTSSLVEFLKLDTNKTMIVAAGNIKNAKQVADDLNAADIKAIFHPNIPTEFPSEKVSVLASTFSAGVVVSEANFGIITHGQLSSALRKRYRTKSENAFHSLDELHKGDYIVHTIHGVGVFEGIEKLTVSGFEKDYIKIKYAKGDVLYVPITQLDLVSKYIGPRDDVKRVKINRLGGKEWEKSKAKVRFAVNDMAKELTELYAKRLATSGYAFSEDIDMQSDFERRFEYDETEDQLNCIREIKEDMEKPVPMDRLLCGDVGFGKTEVALRAAFKCIADQKQCAILVPTTILAFQHYNTILKRFDGFPFEIEMLSRFNSPANQKKIVKDLKNGYVDIVVGTHRLISKDVEFKDLGLLIVDEEQRFGVGQKEELKEKFPNVDVLTLSATPIPRTLNMAMTGIRDMSIIEEAPLDRHPVQTYVLEYDIGVIVSAIEKELRRGGQVYYMHNNIESIIACATKLRELLPEARIGIAHGRMTENALSNVWKQLVEGEIDILCCTTIIETGVDVPNVNTLIVENADRLGLSQLHQIRGRIGRSSRRATAYFTFFGGKELTDIAYRRLTAIREYTEFGSGFKIAMRDLELRGAGSLLGSKQHGHMEVVGYDMYLKILADAIKENKSLSLDDAENIKDQSKSDCLIDIQIDAHIPEKYIESVPHRLAVYRRIADIRKKEDAADVVDELQDRFGEPPQSVLGLIEVSLLRNTAAQIGIYEIAQRMDNLLFYWNDIDMKAVVSLNEAMKGQIRVSAGTKPYISVKVKKQSETIKILKDTLMILANHTRDDDKENKEKSKQEIKGNKRDKRSKRKEKR